MFAVVFEDVNVSVRVKNVLCWQRERERGSNVTTCHVMSSVLWRMWEDPNYEKCSELCEELSHTLDPTLPSPSLPPPPPPPPPPTLSADWRPYNPSQSAFPFWSTGEGFHIWNQRPSNSNKGILDLPDMYQPHEFQRDYEVDNEVEMGVCDETHADMEIVTEVFGGSKRDDQAAVLSQGENVDKGKKEGLTPLVEEKFESALVRTLKQMEESRYRSNLMNCLEEALSTSSPQLMVTVCHVLVELFDPSIDDVSKLCYAVIVNEFKEWRKREMERERTQAKEQLPLRSSTSHSLHIFLSLSLSLVFCFCIILSLFLFSTWFRIPHFQCFS